MQKYLQILLLLLPGPLQSQEKLISAKLESTPIVARTPAGERQMILAEINSDGMKEATLRLTSPEWPRPIEHRAAEIDKGIKTFTIGVPVATSSLTVNGSIEWNGQKKEMEPITLSPPKRWTVYLVQHSHTDIGYTRPQTEILPEHLRYIDYALDFCDLTDSYPEEARFRWTCEISWAVREYLRKRPPEQIERLKRRVKEGRIELTGMFLNMSEIADEGSLAASLQPLAEIRSVFGDNVRSAMQNDVNGAAWCLPDYFSGIGIRYLTMGINKTRSILPFSRPTAFWWESPSGKRLLAFRPDHYMTGNFWQIQQGQAEAIVPGLGRYLNNLVGAGYPWDRIAAQFSGYYTDNSPPARKVCDLVKTWNESYITPRLRIATAREFLEFVEKNHAQALPVHRQAWPDWWTDGFGSAARETAASRQTHAAMQVNDGLMAMSALLGQPPNPMSASRSAAVHESLLFYDEHTFGASESISDPLAENSMIQWGEKSAYAWDAVKNAGLMREEALGLLQDLIPRSDVPVFAVFNTLGRTRSGMVTAFIDQEILPRNGNARIIDPATAEEIKYQALNSRAEGSYWAFWVHDIPAMGYKVFRITASSEGLQKPPEGSAGTSVLENRYYRLEVNPKTGAIASLKDKESGQELADASAPWQLGQFIYEMAVDRRDFDRSVFPKNHPFKRSTLRKVEIGAPKAGPLWQSLLVKAEADGCVEPAGFKMEIRLFETEKRLELHYYMRKAAVTAPESIYVAFPFNSPQGRVFYEGQGGIVTPGEGQLPGSASDWQTIQSFLALRNPSGQIVLTSNDVPLVQLGEINLGKWQPVTKIEKPHVFSWVMNNYWFTNFRASQDGEFRWSYALTSEKNSNNLSASKFGWDTRIPLIGRVLPPGASASRKPFMSSLQIDSPGIQLIAARTGRNGSNVILLLREIEGKRSRARISAAMKGSQVREVNALEEPTQPQNPELEFAPFEAKFVSVSTPGRIRQ